MADQFEFKPETGLLFRNHDKSADSHSDYSGECKIDGVMYYMNAWLNESKKGVKYFSIKFKPKGERSNQSGNKSSNRSSNQADDEGMPF